MLMHCDSCVDSKQRLPHLGPASDSIQSELLPLLLLSELEELESELQLLESLELQLDELSLLLSHERLSLSLALLSR